MTTSNSNALFTPALLLLARLVRFCHIPSLTVFIIFIPVFRFTAPSSPDRHRQALAIFNSTPITDPSISSIPDSAIGDHLYESIARFLDSLGVPRGLKAVGYGETDVERLVEGTLPQRRVLDLAPGIGDVVGEDGKAHLTMIIESSLEY